MALDYLLVMGIINMNSCLIFFFWNIVIPLYGKGDGFQDPHRYQNPRMLKSFVENSIVQSALHTHRLLSLVIQGLLGIVIYAE